ncbi:hypothetical protein GGF32_006433 [Allomyces javanicus]|nr:hypothetical protein GGF32_006433 [Allomyces javanicus]
MAYHTATTSPSTHAPASWSTDLAAADPVAHSQLLASLLDLPDDDDDHDRRHDAPAHEDIAQQLALFSETQFTFANDDVMPNAARMQHQAQTQAPQLDGFLAMGMAASLFGTSAPKPTAFGQQPQVQQQPSWPSVLAPYQQQQIQHQAPTPAVVVPSHPPLYHGVGNAVLGMSPWLPVASAAPAQPTAAAAAASAPAHVTYVLQTTATGQTVMVPVQLAPAPVAAAPAPVVASAPVQAPAVSTAVSAAVAPAPQWTTAPASAAPTAPSTPSPPTTPRLATKRPHPAVPAAVAPAPTPKSPEEPRVRSTVETPHVHIAPTMPSADLSTSVTTTTEPASKRPRTDADDDKRRRNTAASARFRARKKQREQATAILARDLATKADTLSQRVVELETEIAWLRGLLVDRDGHERAAQAARFAVQAAQAGVVPPRTAPDAGGYLAALEAARKAAAAVAAVPPGAAAVVAGAAAPAAAGSA